MSRSANGRSGLAPLLELCAQVARKRLELELLEDQLRDAAEEAGLDASELASVLLPSSGDVPPKSRRKRPPPESEEASSVGAEQRSMELIAEGGMDREWTADTLLTELGGAYGRPYANAILSKLFCKGHLDRMRPGVYMLRREKLVSVREGAKTGSTSQRLKTFLEAELEGGAFATEHFLPMVAAFDRGELVGWSSRPAANSSLSRSYAQAMTLLKEAARKLDVDFEAMLTGPVRAEVQKEEPVAARHPIPVAVPRLRIRRDQRLPKSAYSRKTQNVLFEARDQLRLEVWKLVMDLGLGHAIIASSKPEAGVPSKKAATPFGPVPRIPTAERLSAWDHQARVLWDLPKRLRALSPSSPPEIEHLERVIAQLHRLRSDIVARNTGLAYQAAKKAGFCAFLSEEDLVQAASMGLMKAADRFEPQRGWAFSTFANWWVQHHATREHQDHERTIRLPVHLLEDERRVQRERKQNPNATLEEVSERTKIPAKTIVAMGSYFSGSVSLQTPIGNGHELGDVLVDRAEDVRRESEIAERDHKLLLEKLLAGCQSLTDREREIIHLRFGLGPTRETMTLEEVSKHYDLTRERIRQIELKALGKLRKAAKRSSAIQEEAEELLGGRKSA